MFCVNKPNNKLKYCRPRLLYYIRQGRMLASYKQKPYKTFKSYDRVLNDFSNGLLHWYEVLKESDSA